MTVKTPNAAAERALACEVFEFGAIFSVNSGDKEAFQRYLLCLRPYYTSYDTGSDLKYQILGLNLLFLLVENRLSDFHAELELLSEEEQLRPAIFFCTQLDRHLMVGSYAEVMIEAANPPFEYYSFFLKSLLETVRMNIGECVATSYRKLTLAGAREVLMFNSIEETKAFIKEHHEEWTIDGDVVEIQGQKVSKSEEIPSLKLITQTLLYATELERIV